MHLNAWRGSWMWIAMSACGGAPGWMKTPPPVKTSVFDAPPFSTAAYFALMTEPDFGHPGRDVQFERGRYSCTRLVTILQARSQGDELPGAAGALATCPREVASALAQPAGLVYVDGGTGGRWLSAADLLAAAVPIDSPAKAMLAVWLLGRYTIGWGDDSGGHGHIDDGRFRQVRGGFEIAGSETQGSDCGGSKDQPMVQRTFRLILFVDPKGSVVVRDRTETARSVSTEECHPLGRRPSDFTDIASDGTIRGYFERAMHHEAESVRAFERLARELRAHGAPSELADAAARAARDERDHARRFADLLGTRAVIGEDALPVRSLRELAIDNATEGCVGESFAALEAAVQATNAASPELRAHFAAIASDELAHAALAHAIAQWIDSVVTAHDRAAILAAREGAMSRLEATTLAWHDGDRVLGLPCPPEARRLAAVVRAVNAAAADEPSAR